MTVVRDITLSLTTQAVFRREGVSEYSRLRPEIGKLVNELLARVDCEHLVEPAIAYEIYPITEKSRDQLTLQGSTVVHGPLVPSFFPEARELAVAVCTIGPRLEQESKMCFSKSEPLRGLLLDGIGSAAVDALNLEVCRIVTREASFRNCQASSPLNPGMPGFPLSEQQQLFGLVPADEIGVRLTSTGMMIPLKSLSMVIGIGPRMPTWTQADVCAHCNLRATCPYRIPAQAAKQ